MISHAPAGYRCPFCRVQTDDPEDPSGPPSIVHADDDVFVLVNGRWWPRNPGAVLVIPRQHHENVFDLPPALGTPIQAAVRDSALALRAAYGCDGISTRQHNEPAGNQAVWHFHVHVFPRWHGDDLYRSDHRLTTREEREPYAARLSRTLGR